MELESKDGIVLVKGPKTPIEALQEELEELRAYKAAKASSRADRAFNELQLLLDNAHFEPGMSRRAFRVLAECIFILKEGQE